MKVFEIARFMPETQQDSYQGSIIWFCGKTTLKKRIPGSLYWQSSTFKGSSPPTTKITQRSRQQYPSPLLQPYQWLSPPLHQWQGPQRLQQRNVVELLRPPSPSKSRSLKPLLCLIFSSFLLPSPAKVGRFFIKHT